METFLDNLARRGCRFHIIWFDDNEELCVPPLATEPELYLLTRAVLIKHLARHDAISGSGKLSFQFPGAESTEYEQYLKDNALFFFLYLDGRACFESEDGRQAAQYLDPVYKLGLLGYSVAFLDTLEFASSKVRNITDPLSQDGWRRPVRGVCANQRCLGRFTCRSSLRALLRGTAVMFKRRMSWHELHSRRSLI